MKELYLQEQLNNNPYIKTVAFDFFDTLIERDCAPEQILFEWSKNITSQFNFDMMPSHLYDARKKAEKVAKLEGIEELTYKELLHRTYQAINPEKENEEVFLSIAKETEMEIELAHFSGRNSIISQIASLASRYEIILISDFYMDSSVFENILSKLNIRQYFSKLYISSEVNARKSSGKLYQYVLKDLQLKPENLLMVGDNENSDYRIPQSLGIQAYHIDSPENNYSILTLNDLKRQYKRLMSDYDRNVLGGYIPEVAFFVSALHKELIKNNVELVLFCSREGQLLKKLFDEYQNIFFINRKIRTEYFYVSRKSTFLPSLEEFSKERFSNLFRQFSALNVYDFLNSIGFEAGEIDEILLDTGINRNQMIESGFENPIRKKLTESALFIDKYNAKRLNQYQLFLNYINNLGIDVKKDTITLVDIGWKGTIQDNIKRILPDYATIKGYYFGLLLNEYQSDNQVYKVGIMFTDYPEKSKNFDLLTRDHMFWERIFVADHGPVLGYAASGSIVVPVIDNSPEQLEIYNYMSEYQLKMEKTFSDMLKCFDRSKYLPCELYDLMIEFALRKKCMYFPKIWKVEKTARSISKENFGNVSKNKNKIKVAFGKEQKRKKDFLFVDYVYRILDKYHLRFLYPLANLYCHCVYFIKKRSIEK